MELLGIWKNIYNPNFNYGEFAIIKNQAGFFGGFELRDEGFPNFSIKVRDGNDNHREYCHYNKFAIF